MDEGFRNQFDWRTAAAALAVWAAHFTVLWAASIIFPDQPAARWLAVGCTGVAFAALFLLWHRARPVPLRSGHALVRGIAGLGTLYDAMPVLLT